MSHKNKSNLDNNLMDNGNNGNDKKEQKFTFTAHKIIGSGSFGTVYQATIAETGETVAIKKVLQDKKYKNREHQILQIIDNENLIKLKQAFFTEGEKHEELYLNVVMEFIPETLSKLIRQYYKSKIQMPMMIVKLYSYQMFRGLAYLETIGICHRDIKPQNVLIDPTTHALKICDFGSAKKLVKGEPNIAYICSRYYRAPELIFGLTNYTNTIDVWSTGCVIAEMVLGYPIFHGESSVDQLVEIIKILGTPTKDQILEMNPEYDDFKFPNIKSTAWSKVFKNKGVTDEFIDFISNILVYEPKKRLKPLKALLHPFFDELRQENAKLPNDNKLPNLFNFSEAEIKSDPDTINKLIPDWFIKK